MMHETRPGRRILPTAAVTLLVIFMALASPLSADAATAPTAEADVTRPYSARYAVYRNGKLQARAEFLLEREADGWVMKSESVGTHGMARLLKFRDYEYAEGAFVDSGTRPMRYIHELKWMGPNQDSSALFDWEAGTVNVTADGESRDLELVEGAVDPMSLQIEIRRGLASGNSRMEFMLVEEDEIELQVFRTLPRERLETSLGCLATLPVEKVREGSTRFTRFWHAEAFSFIPVRMEHGKTDGDQMQLRITELVLDGKPVAPQPGCAAVRGEQP